MNKLSTNRKEMLMVNPKSLKGREISHANKYGANASKAIGQHRIKRMSHRRNESICV